MEKEQVEMIFNKISAFAGKKVNPNIEPPQVNLIIEKYDIYNSNQKSFQIFINSDNKYWSDEKVKEEFNTNLRELARTARLFTSINYQIYLNSDIPERYDSIVSSTENFKIELENKLSKYHSDDNYFEVIYVGPESPNWTDVNVITLRVIVRLNTIDPTDDSLLKATEKTLNIVLSKMVRDKYQDFDGYSLHLDVEELDSSEEELPYDEEINESHRVRVFSESVDDEDLKWHRDREDRLIEVIDGSDWEIQFDNELPKKLTPGTQIIIPEGVYHRVIKGSSELKIKVHFLN